MLRSEWIALAAACHIPPFGIASKKEPGLSMRRIVYGTLPGAMSLDDMELMLFACEAGEKRPLKPPEGWV